MFASPIRSSAKGPSTSCSFLALFRTSTSLGKSPIVRGFGPRLAAFARLIMFDKRGTGLSDRTVGVPTLEERMDDVRAVMDAVGSQQAALFGISEGGAMSVLFAATYPERTRALVLYGPLQLVGCAPGHDRCRPGSHGTKLGDRREPPFVRPQCGIR